MAIHANAGTQFAIGTTAILATADEFAADDWTAIRNLKDVGESGPEADILTSKHVDRPEGVRKLKGVRDAGTMSLVVDRDSSDAGYRALIAAEKTSDPFNFKLVLDDAPNSGVNPKPSVFYFSAFVASAKNAFGDADAIIGTTFSLAITGAIIEVPASSSAS